MAVMILSVPTHGNLDVNLSPEWANLRDWDDGNKEIAKSSNEEILVDDLKLKLRMLLLKLLAEAQGFDNRFAKFNNFSPTSLTSEQL